ncbi:MAG: hypothetical protein ACI8P9_000027 [Parasphingorhabdus sp.]|jgi:hypothetical protein
MIRLFQIFLISQFFMSSLALASEDWGFDALMEELAKHPQFSADFEEQRSSMFLSRPLKLHGILIFVANEKMEKRVVRPYVETTIIDDAAVVIRRTNTIGKEDTTHVTRFSLAAHPAIAKAINGVSNIFSGDSSLLKELYDWQIEGQRDDWGLLLKPKDGKLAEFISSIELRGHDGIITQMNSVEADGDESKMALSNRSTDIPELNQ